MKLLRGDDVRRIVAVEYVSLDGLMKDPGLPTMPEGGRS
jgi:hypothetical protein